MTMNTAADTPIDAPVTRERLKQLVHSFYDDVRADEKLGPVFDGAIGDHWDTHLERMVEFWSTVMLGTRSFSGNVFGKHMALDGIEPDYFLRWITLWHKHTNRLFAPAFAAELQRTAMGIGRNLFHGFFGEFPSFVVEDGVAVAWRGE
jgi:hemoglobin